MSRDVAIVIGTVVGGIYGDAGMGYAIGSLVGNAYDPVQIGRQGPRLNDLKVQTSNYGKMMPKLYGSSRFAGNVIWSTDIVEAQHSETEGGKGGSPEVTTTSYSYSQSFAVGLCEGEIVGIGKIWANGKLIYNMGPDADFVTLNASRQLLQYMRVYTGSETQVADSLIETHVGTGNVPAYRGTAYVVFENLPLSNFFNRTPQLEFEVQEGIEGEATTAVISALIGFTTTTAQSIATFGGHYLAAIRATTAPNGILDIYDIGNPLIPRLVYSLTIPNGYPPGIGTGIASNGVSQLYLVSIYGYFTVVDVSNPNAPSIVGTLSGFGSNNIVTVVPHGTYAYLLGWASDVIYVISFAGTLMKVAQVTSRNAPQRGFILGGYLYVSHYADGYLQIWSLANPTAPVLAGEVDVGSSAVDVVVSGSYAFVASGAGVHICNVTNKSAPTLSATSAIGATQCLHLTPQGYLVAGTTSANGVRLLDVSSPTAPSVLASLTTETSIELILESGGTLWALNAGTKIQGIYYGDQIVTRVATTVGAAVSDICTRAGLTAAQIDVTQLTDDLDGYVVQRSPARVQIEQLMQTFYFDAVESDGKVKFVKRGGAAALTIAEDDLAAHLYGGQVPENLILERKQEMELPVEVNVQYMDLDAAYQVNSQRTQRQVTESSNKLALNFAISMSATKAKQVADVLMYDAWTSRTSLLFSNAWKYSYLEPTDVVNVVKGSRTYYARIVDEDSSSGVYLRGAVIDDAAVYTQTATAAPPTTPGSTVDVAPIIDLELMDIPLLRDQDDGLGFYAAACKYSGTWVGAQAYKSNDGGASWASFGRAMLNEATIGAASTAIGDFLGGNIFDELNSVTIVMINGTLSSTTELAVLNGANVMLLGSEIIQFKNATLTATSTYVLTGLLRGRLGTEWAMNEHVVGERAVLLSTSTTYLFESSSSEYNLSRDYKAAAFGSFLDDAYASSFTNTGVAQECYAPVQLGGGRNAANDVLLKWVRRTRLGGAWNDYSDVPVGEASEAYVVEIYSDGTYATVLRTISGITAQTTTYTAAQQTADGLTPGNPVYFIVYQVSATVGNGYGARGVV